MITLLPPATTNHTRGRAASAAPTGRSSSAVPTRNRLWVSRARVAGEELAVSLPGSPTINTGYRVGPNTSSAVAASPPRASPAASRRPPRASVPSP
jgi:hypothetical protein